MAEKDLANKQDAIFFFGAGASVDAGIPDTYAFARDFEEYIKISYPSLYPSLSKIFEKRQKNKAAHYFPELKKFMTEGRVLSQISAFMYGYIVFSEQLVIISLTLS